MMPNDFVERTRAASRSPWPLGGGKMQEQVARLLPQREGHFVFESGHHGQVWLDLELLLLHPERVQPLAEALADRLRGHQVTAVCGPLVEGAFVVNDQMADEVDPLAFLATTFQ